MRTKSCKAKGRKLCSEVVELLHQYAPDLKPGDIRVTSSGATGPDVLFSPAAQEIYHLVIEGKCQESLNIWEALKQAEGHREKCDVVRTPVPVVFFRRNRSKMYVALPADDFVWLIR